MKKDNITGITAPSAKVYMHVPDAGKARRIRALCQQNHLSCIEIGNDRVNQTVLQLISGMPGLKPAKERCAPAMYFLPELMLLQGMTDQDLFAFLDAYREEGIPPITLKATITPYTLTWTLYELAEHLREEAKEAGNAVQRH